MHILTFDTALDKTYISLFEDEREILSTTIESTDDKYHSAFLIQQLVDLLKKHSLTMKDIQAIGVNVGPGSFTGIRACLTIARVIAQQLECPLIGVPSLEILSKINNSDKPCFVIMDARKEMCYFAEFGNDGKTIQETCLKPLSELDLNTQSHIIITDKAMQNYLAQNNIKAICYSDENPNLGRELGKITIQKLKESSKHHWAKVKPIYLQNPSITISKKTII